MTYKYEGLLLCKCQLSSHAPLALLHYKFTGMTNTFDKAAFASPVQTAG